MGVSEVLYYTNGTKWRKTSHILVPTNPFNATGFFLHPLNTAEQNRVYLIIYMGALKETSNME